MAASERPIASVLLPLPPFWVASTIVYILIRSLGFVSQGFAVRSTVASNSTMPSILAQDVPARSVKLSWIAAVRITKPRDDALLLARWLFRNNTSGRLR